MSAPRHPSATPLVGRDHELECLRLALSRSTGGEGTLVLVSGEAGIGKTALVNALTADAVAGGCTLLTGHCYDRSETPPYGPWIESFARVNGAGLAGTLPDPPSLSGVTDQQAYFARVRSFLVGCCERTPLVVVFEDLHWADSASLDLLRFITRSVATLPVLIVATYRADELTRSSPLAALVPLMTRESEVERINLRPLTEAAIEQLVALRYELPRTASSRLARYLIARTDGNPLFLTELLRTFEEEGLIIRDEQGWRLGNFERAPVPLLLRQIINARLGRLGDQGAALLSVAAVIGHHVSLTIWEAATEIAEDVLVPVAERAESANLVSAWSTGDGISFVHALIREALYEGVPAFQRRRLHRRVGEIIAGSAAPDPAVVAYHFRQAGDERAPEWLVRAGERAQQEYALVTAVECFAAAFTLLDAQGKQPGERGWLRLLAAVMRHYEEPSRARLWVDEALLLAGEANDASLAARALAVRGLLRSYRGELPAGIDDLSRAAEAIEQIPPGTDVMHEREQRIDRVANAGTRIAFLAFSGHLNMARQQGERYLMSIGTSDVHGEQGALADVFNGLSMLHGMQGEPDRAVQVYRDAVNAYDSIGHPFMSLSKQREMLSLIVLPYYADNLSLRERVADTAVQKAANILETGARIDGTDARIARLPLFVLEGQWSEALRLVETTDVWDVSKELLFHCFALGPTARNQGNADRAWQYVREAWPEGPDIEPGNRFVPYAVPLLLLGAMLALDDNDLSTARRWLDAHRRWMNFMDATLGRADEEIVEARWQQVAGNQKQALMHATRALEHATKPRQPLGLIAAHRVLGELKTSAGRYAEAAEHLTESLQRADACLAPYERALSLFVRAELEVAQAQTEQARETLEAVCAICEPMGAHLLLNRVEALAARLDAVPETIPNPAGLSDRELEVLQLVATGLTNAQTAERLFVSPRTINAHLTSIYAKLGVPSRAAAIRFAFEQGIA